MSQVLVTASQELPDPPTAMPEQLAAGLARIALPAAPRLPVLDRLLEALPGLITGKFKASWGQQVTVRRTALAVERLSVFAETIEATALVGTFSAANSDEFGLLAFDRRVVLDLIERALGGRGGMPAPAALERPLTLIETTLMRPAASHVLEALGAALKPAGEIALTFARWHGDPAPFRSGRAGDSAIIISLEIVAGEATGAIRLALPLVQLDPLRAALEAVYPGDAPALQSAWKRRLAAEVARAPVRLTAILHEAEMPLATIHALKVGDTLSFDAPADPLVTLVAGGMRLAEGRLGRSGPYVAIRLEGCAEAKREDQP